jgi:hypothetical protein
MSTITAQIQLRRDTSANWTSNNPILLAGEMALSTDVLYTGTDQPRYKIGNGVDTWLNLDYVPEGGGGTSYPENLFLTVVNKTGDNLLASGYKVLKVQNAQGQRLAVDYALADSNGNSVDTIGVVSENISNNQTGKIIVIGEITGLNTTGSLQGESWNDGDVLYLSSSTPGNLTKVQPTAPNHLVVVGYVVYAHANQGKIYCKVQNGWEIGELHDCYLPSPSNNDGIFWNSTTTRYENKSIVTVLGYTPIKYLSKTEDSSSITGTVSNVLLDSLLIPSNTFKVGISKFTIRNKYTGTAGAKTTRIYLNTSNSLTGATLLATYTAGSGALSVDMGRLLAVKSSTSLEVYNSSATALTSEVQSTTAISTITIDITNQYYIIVAIQLTNSADSAINSYIYFEV